MGWTYSRGFETARTQLLGEQPDTRRQPVIQPEMPSRLVRDASAFFLRSLYRRVPRLMRALSGSTSSRRPAHGDIPWAARVLPVSRLGSYAERGTWRPPTTSRHEGESSRPPGGSPWVGLGGTRRGIERLVATPSACAGACCSRASCRSTSYGCRMPWLKYIRLSD